MVAKKFQSPNVVVCVPSTGTWTSDTSRCMALMFSHFAMYKVRGAHTQKLSLLSSDGSMLSSLRELMVKKVLGTNASHLLFIDSDMTFPKDTLKRLVEHRKPFVAANCTTRKHPVETVAHDLSGERVVSIGQAGLQEVQHVGLAVALIETEALKALRPPLFLMDWIPSLGTYCGEDVYFCQKLVESGVKLYIDHALSREIGHVGQYIYGHEDVEGADQKVNLRRLNE